MKTTVTGVEMFRKLLDQGEAGDNVGCLLRGTKREDVERGQILCKPGSVKPHTKFKAEAPDAIFIGGGVTRDGVLDTCWQHLRPGGRLVANAVTLQSEMTLMAMCWKNAVSSVPRKRFMPWAN